MKSLIPNAPTAMPGHLTSRAPQASRPSKLLLLALVGGGFLLPQAAAAPVAKALDEDTTSSSSSSRTLIVGVVDDRGQAVSLPERIL